MELFYRCVSTRNADLQCGLGVPQILSGNSLAVYYISGSGGRVMLYEADGDNWKGIWARADDDTLGAEVWKRK